jgi:hypothetical protein
MLTTFGSVADVLIGETAPPRATYTEDTEITMVWAPHAAPGCLRFSLIRKAARQFSPQAATGTRDLLHGLLTATCSARGSARLATRELSANVNDLNTTRDCDWLRPRRKVIPALAARKRGLPRQPELSSAQRRKPRYGCLPEDRAGDGRPP